MGTKNETNTVSSPVQEVNLFSNNSRSRRQDLAVQKWVDNKLRGICICPTGFGKTRVGMLAITRFLKKNSTRQVIIVVPSDPIKQQWINETIDWQCFDNCQVKTMYDVSKNTYTCDLLVIDEIHKTLSPTLINLYTNITYKAILGLTATLERLDGRETLILNDCPVVDTVTMDEAIKNNWLSEYKEYVVLIDVPDYDKYAKLNQEFQEHFAFFNFNFELAMACATSWQRRAALAKERCHGDDFKEVNKQILVHAVGFSRTLQERKKFIYHHPKKIELAELILEHRMDKKCITFSSTIKMAEQIKYGSVYSGKDTAKKGRITLAEFINQDGGILNTVSKVNEGLNCPDISVAIMLGINSSKTTAAQRKGRAIRQKEGKIAEVFILVIKNTVEEKWLQNGFSGDEYTVIGEDDLINVLEGKEFTKKKKKETSILFRF